MAEYKGSLIINIGLIKKTMEKADHSLHSIIETHMETDLRQVATEIQEIMEVILQTTEQEMHIRVT